MFKRFLTKVLFFACFHTWAQFIFPLKEPVQLTGNYGEVRPNHFHAGIDFKTHPTDHVPIHAVADGYISRIKVSTYGYGKVLYITHPNGLVSVYGHQFDFNDAIKKYTETVQRASEVFEIELFPKPNELPVKQNEIIGYTGNTGSSQGPHLHFELRDAKTEVPYNPLHYLTIKDVVPPKISSVGLYKSDGTLHKIFIPKKNDTIACTGPVAFALNTHDTEQPGGNKNNTYKIEIYVDGKLFYQHILDSISFDLARYVNTYSDYDVKKARHITLQKLFREKNNDLPIYKTIRNNGFLYFDDANYHSIKIVALDYYNLKNEISFHLKTKPEEKSKKGNGKWHNCLEAYMEVSDNYSLLLHAKSLYHDTKININYTGVFFSFSAYNYDIPFQNSATVRLKVPENLKKYGEKLCLAQVNKAGKTYCGGSMENNFLKTDIRNFGDYIITMDTVAPHIRLKNGKNKTYKSGQTIYFQVTDDFSGIQNFKLYINNKWYPSEYEHKNNSIFFYISETIPKGKANVKLEVNDKRNNKASYSISLVVE